MFLVKLVALWLSFSPRPHFVFILAAAAGEGLAFFASQQVTLAATRISGHLKKCLMLNCSSEIDSFVMSRAFGL